MLSADRCLTERPPTECPHLGHRSAPSQRSAVRVRPFGICACEQVWVHLETAGGASWTSDLGPTPTISSEPAAEEVARISPVRCRGSGARGKVWVLLRQERLLLLGSHLAQAERYVDWPQSSCDTLSCQLHRGRHRHGLADDPFARIDRWRWGASAGGPGRPAVVEARRVLMP